MSYPKYSERSNYTEVITPISRHTTSDHRRITGVSVQGFELGVVKTTTDKTIKMLQTRQTQNGP